MRFQVIKNKEIIQLVLKNLIGYSEIYGDTGGNNDFICIDTLNKQWCWCEHGFYPFCSEESMSPYQFKSGDLRLSHLVTIRQ